jgi:hypothetical protein
LLPDQRRWIAIYAVGVTAGTNLVVNALIAWASVSSLSRVPLWAVPLVDKPSTITDTVGTFFFLPLTTCLICTTAVRVEVRARRLSPLAVGELGMRLRRLPSGIVRRGLLLGTASAATFGPLSALVLWTARFGDVTRTEFIVYKAVLGVVLGAIVTPLIALRAMADPVTQSSMRFGPSSRT